MLIIPFQVYCPGNQKDRIYSWVEWDKGPYNSSTLSIVRSLVSYNPRCRYGLFDYQGSIGHWCFPSPISNEYTLLDPLIKRTKNIWDMTSFSFPLFFLDKMHFWVLWHHFCQTFFKLNMEIVEIKSFLENGRFLFDSFSNK